MRRFVIVAIVAGLPGLAAAQESMTPSEQASRCWNVPSQAVDQSATMEFDVQLDEHGNVLDITVTRYQPQSDLGKVIVLSASRAIEQCAPYDVPSAGTHAFTFDLADMFGPASGIDPFKAKQ